MEKRLLVLSLFVIAYSLFAFSPKSVQAQTSCANPAQPCVCPDGSSSVETCTWVGNICASYWYGCPAQTQMTSCVSGQCLNSLNQVIPNCSCAEALPPRIPPPTLPPAPTGNVCSVCQNGYTCSGTDFGYGCQSSGSCYYSGCNITAPPPIAPPPAAPRALPPPASAVCFDVARLLTLNGNFIAKGGFKLYRDLGEPQNRTIPAEVFVERPDFWITINRDAFPALIRDVLVIPNYNWQEVTP